ncbi:hypothetical protein NO1_1745, partial [Candidatus Termititenax aidoneus]
MAETTGQYNSETGEYEFNDGSYAYYSNKDDKLHIVSDNNGPGGALNHHDFGASPASGALPEAWQENLTEYACQDIWGDGGVFAWNSAEPWNSTYEIDETTHNAEEIFNSTWVRNDNDNHKFVLTNTPNTTPQIFDWTDVGQDTVTQFTDTLAGVIKGNSSAFGKIKSNSDGTGSVNGLLNSGDGTKALMDDGSYKSPAFLPIPAALLTALYAEGFNTSASGNAVAAALIALANNSQYSGYVNFETKTGMNLPNTTGTGFTGTLKLYKSITGAYVRAELFMEGDRTTISIAGAWECKW